MLLFERLDPETLGKLVALYEHKVFVQSVVLDVNPFWAVLLAWYVVMGAGRLSMDRSLARGLADSALPGAAAAVRLFSSATRYLGPLLKLAMRLWLTMAWLAGTGGDIASDLGKVVLPLQTAAHFPSAIAIAGAPLLALGLATRFTALLLMAATAGGPMMERLGSWGLTPGSHV